MSVYLVNCALLRNQLIKDHNIIVGPYKSLTNKLLESFLWPVKKSWTKIYGDLNYIPYPY